MAFRTVTVFGKLNAIRSAVLKQSCRGLQSYKDWGVKLPIPPKALKQDLPRQHLPGLQETLNKLLRSAEPLLSGDELAHTKQLCADFAKPGGQGEQLHKALEERHEKLPNWLGDWWLQIKYLQTRSSMPIFSNPTTYSEHDFQGHLGQIHHAALLTSLLQDVREKLSKYEYPTMYVGKDPQCMTQHYNLLHCCREPAHEMEHVVHWPIVDVDPTNLPKHVTVLKNGHVFSMDVYNIRGQRLSVRQIQQQLSKILAESEGMPGPGVGIMTAGDREPWAKTYNKLMNDKQNEATLREIQSSMFVLCLDKHMPSDIRSKYDVVAGQMLHGGGSHWNSPDRWFDKTTQIIVSEDGFIGVNYDHGPIDGIPVQSVVQDCMEKLMDNRVASALDVGGGIAEPRKLRFNLSSDVKADLNQGRDWLDTMVDNFDVKASHFREFGKELAKSHKVSPDGYIQTVLQLAFYRGHGVNTAQWASGGLKKFKGGRTDTIRTCSLESVLFSRAMDDNSVPSAQKAKMFKEAINAYVKNAKEVMNGHGIDKHLFGLSQIAVENGLPLPELFLDQAWKRTTCFRLSTSQVPFSREVTMYYGPLELDGFGFCYNPLKDQLRYVMTGFKDNPNSIPAAKFSELFERSLLDVHRMLLEAEGKASEE